MNHENLSKKNGKGGEMKYKKIILLLFICIFTLKGAFFEKANVLKNLKEVDIVIEGLPEDASKIGLTKERIKTVVELCLRREGIKIIKDVRAPYIYININVLGLAFNISFELREPVTILRIPNEFCLATTWDKGFTGTHGNNPEYIVSSIKLLLDKFLNDYYKANPKK